MDLIKIDSSSLQECHKQAFGMFQNCIFSAKGNLTARTSIGCVGTDFRNNLITLTGLQTKM